MWSLLVTSLDLHTCGWTTEAIRPQRLVGTVAPWGGESWKHPLGARQVARASGGTGKAEQKQLCLYCPVSRQ